MKKTNFLSSYVGKFFFVLCFFVTLGLSNASAQTLKQGDNASAALKQEGKLLLDKLATLPTKSSTHRYTAAKVSVVRALSQAINAGQTTEDALEAVFTHGAGRVETEENTFLDKQEEAQAKAELETILK